MPFLRSGVRVRVEMLLGAVVLALGSTTLQSCGGTQGRVTAPSSSHCDAVEPPSLSESQMLPTKKAGGPNAWFQVKVTRVEPVLKDNHVLLDGEEIAIVDVTTTKPSHGADVARDPTEGRLIPKRAPAARESNPYSNVIGFRIPPGTPPGAHQISFKTCAVAAPESVTIDVLPSPAPVITSIKVTRRDQWFVLFIKGSNLVGTDEVLLLAGDGSVSTITSVTKIDDTEIRATLDAPGTFDVFVASSNGVGGGPPNGSVIVR